MKVGTVFKVAGWVVLGVALATVLAFLLGVAVMALWNWLMPAIFGLPTISYWQAVGLFILCHLLFKSHHEGHRHGDKKSGDGRHIFAQKVRRFLCGERSEAGDADVDREGNAEAEGA